MNPTEAALLGAIQGAGCPTALELRMFTHSQITPILERLILKGYVDCGSAGRYSTFRGRPVENSDKGAQYTVTEKGEVALKCIYGRKCDWCGRGAINGCQIKGAATFVYWCGKHAKIGWDSANEGELATKGSLHGEMVRGKLGEAEEARA